MDLESQKKLELDVRMMRRRDWMKPEELEKRLAALPDVSDKVAPIESEPADSSD